MVDPGFLRQATSSMEAVEVMVLLEGYRDYVGKVRADDPEGMRTIQAEIAIQYNDSYTENIYAFANTIANPDGGTHVSGFRRALTRTLNEYAKRNEMLKKVKEGISGEDVREGLTAVISVKISDPQFEGQTKGKLLNMEVEGLVTQIVNEGMSEHLEEKLQGIRCHVTQVGRENRFADTPDEVTREAWFRQEAYVLAHSTVGYPQETETDLFAGLR